MDFILIYPPSAERVAEFPVGGLFLAESLKSRGYTCGIICDRNISEIYDELDKLVDSDTIAIGISVVSTLIFKDTVHISKKVQELYQNIPLPLLLLFYFFNCCTKMSFVPIIYLNLVFFSFHR